VEHEPQMRPGSTQRGRTRSEARVARGVGAALALFAPAMLTGCGSGGARQTLQKVASWTATARMAADELEARHTTPRYTGKTLAVASDQVASQARSFAPNDLPGALRAPAVGAVTAARQAIRDMSRAAERRDGAALARAAARADSADRALDALLAALPER